MNDDGKRIGSHVVCQMTRSDSVHIQLRVS
jgi:hypothetical protein